MRRSLALVPALAISLLAAVAAAGGQQAGPRPTPDSPGIRTSAAELASALRAASVQHPELALATIGVTDQYQIHEVRRSKASGGPAIHHGWTELQFVLSGSGTFVTGGRIEVRPGRPLGVIVGGKSQRVHAGDAVIVPPETPHQYTKIDSKGLTVLEVRLATPAGATP
ncbi:MAG: AraC family ligand binding domain-containing protein [Steroidobacteraceae bacterium]